MITAYTEVIKTLVYYIPYKTAPTYTSVVVNYRSHYDAAPARSVLDL